MTDEKMRRMEEYIVKSEGNLTHVKRVLHISRILAHKEQLSYHEDALVFSAYFHDISAYPPFSPSAVFDHALESGRLMPQLMKEWDMDVGLTGIVVEAVANHNKAGLGQYNETRLIRNADGLDYLGCMAVARDFSKQPKDLRRAMAALRGRYDSFAPLIDLDSARELAAPRIAELELFIRRFEEESFGIY